MYSNEIKAKVMAPYIGAKCEYKWNREDDLLTGKLTPRILESLYLDNGVINHCVIEIKPLSEITDEHVIEVLKISGHTNIKSIIIVLDGIWINFQNTGFRKFVFFNDLDSESVEYLRDKGYDYKHYLLNGQTLQQAGMAVYKTKTTE